MLRNLTLAALLAAILCLPMSAQAQWPGLDYYGAGWQPGYGQGVFPGSSARPPYFSLYPPVYYSNQIVRRPMGPSPFAYPSWYSPAETAVAAAAPSEPLMIVNPFVKAAAEKTTEE